jgi:hypothetical protein
MVRALPDQWDQARSSDDHGAAPEATYIDRFGGRLCRKADLAMTLAVYRGPCHQRAHRVRSDGDWLGRGRWRRDGGGERRNAAADVLDGDRRRPRGHGDPSRRWWGSVGECGRPQKRPGVTAGSGRLGSGGGKEFPRCSAARWCSGHGAVLGGRDGFPGVIAVVLLVRRAWRLRPPPAVLIPWDARIVGGRIAPLLYGQVGGNQGPMRRLSTRAGAVRHPTVPIYDHCHGPPRLPWWL